MPTGTSLRRQALAILCLAALALGRPAASDEPKPETPPAKPAEPAKPADAAPEIPPAVVALREAGLQVDPVRGPDGLGWMVHPARHRLVSKEGIDPKILELLRQVALLGL